MLAQVVPVLLAPVLSRLFTPEEFGVFFLYNALLTLLVVFTSGRYELAIHLPASDSTAVGLVRVVLCMSGVAAVFVLVIVALFGRDLATLFGEPALSPWLWLLAPSVVLAGIYMALYYWDIRQRFFRTNSESRIAEAVCSGGVRTGAGLMGMGTGGLIAGSLLGRVSAILMIWFRIRRDYPKVHSSTGLWSLAKKYRSFPLRMTWGSFFNLGAQQSPNIILTRLFGAAVVGPFGMMDRIVRIPLGAISVGFGDVFRQRAAERIQTSGSCRSLFCKTALALAIFGLPVLVVLLLFGPSLFGWMLGSQWIVAGEIARIFAAPIYLSFVVSPLTHLYYIINKTATYLQFHLAMFVAVVASLIGCGLLTLGLRDTLLILAAAYALPQVLMLMHLFTIASRSHTALP